VFPSPYTGRTQLKLPRYSHPALPAHVAIPATVPVAHTGRRPLTRTFLERKWVPRVAPRSPFRNHQDAVPPGTPNADVSPRIPSHGANSTQVARQQGSGGVHPPKCVTIPLHGAWFDKLTNRSRNQQDGVPPGTPEEHASVPIPLHGANSTQAIPGPATRRFRHRSQSLQPFRLPTRGGVL